MARVKMKQTAAGPAGVFEEGKSYDLDGELASHYVSHGAAEWVGNPPEHAVRRAPETRGEPEAPVDLSGLSKRELVALAEERGIEVTRSDGGDGAPLRSDYEAALS